MKSLYSALVDFESRCSSHYVGLGINLMLYYPESEFSLGTIAALCCAVEPFIIHVVPFADDSTSPSSFVSSSPSPLLSLACPETSSAATTRDQTAADTVGLGELTGRKKQHVCLSFPLSVVATVQSLED